MAHIRSFDMVEEGGVWVRVGAGGDIASELIPISYLYFVFLHSTIPCSVSQILLVNYPYVLESILNIRFCYLYSMNNI
jgi:hypothetical protein